MTDIKFYLKKKQKNSLEKNEIMIMNAYFTKVIKNSKFKFRRN